MIKLRRLPVALLELARLARAVAPYAVPALVAAELLEELGRGRYRITAAGERWLGGESG